MPLLSGRSLPEFLSSVLHLTNVAALRENIILLTNLSWSAVLYTRFLTRRASLGKLQRWQTAYIPIYALRA